MAETFILPLSATYSLSRLGLRGVEHQLIAWNCQLYEVFLDPPGSMGLECGRGAGLTDLPSPFLRKRN